MSRTFIGELILRLKDEMSGKAKTAASNLDTSIGKIERAAQRMNSIPWGGKFDDQIRRLGVGAKDIDALSTSFGKLQKSIADRNLSKTMAELEKSNFKTSALSHFSAIAAGAKEADTNVSNFHRTWTAAAKDMAMYGTIGAIMYGGVNAARGGIKANAEFQREEFQQKNANIPQDERNKILAEADRLTTKYPSAGLVNVLQMARTARAMMGDTQRGLEILPDLVKGLVALQTSNTDPEVANGVLDRLLRGIDNAGKNSAGDLGIQNTKEIIAGLIRASQIEGNQLNVGDMWTFMRRAKIAGPGLSTEFLANVAPAIIQDMTAPTAGTSLSSAFQAYVIGSNAVASKKNIAEQKRLKIRKNGKLVNSELMANNPYQWATEVLLPALQADGVDVDNDAALAEAIAKTSRNTSATAMLTKMLQQRQQIDRTIEQYKKAVGPDSADAAAAEDPFVAMKGFVESWRELATSIKGMPEAVSGLNMLTAGIQRFSTALREKDGAAQALLAGGGIVGAIAGFKMMKGIWDLSTAGTSLQLAAAELKAAAVSLRTGKPGADGPGQNGNNNSVFGSFGALLTGLNFLATGLQDMPSTVQEWLQLEKLIKERDKRANDWLEKNIGTPSSWLGLVDPKQIDLSGLRNRSGSPDDRDERHRAINPYDTAMDFMESRRLMEQATTPVNGNTPGLQRYFPDQPANADQPTKVDQADPSWDIGSKVANVIYELMKPTRDKLFEEVPAPIVDNNGAKSRTESMPAPIVDKSADAYQQNGQTRQASGISANPQVTPDVDMSNATAAASEAASVGQQIQSALSVSATPQVNLGQLQQAVALARQFVSIMQQASSAVTTAHQSVAGEMRRNFADHGVSP